MKLRSTWYRAKMADGTKTTISVCPDVGAVSLAWNRGYQDLNDWTEKGLKSLIESEFGTKVVNLTAA